MPRRGRQQSKIEREASDIRRFTGPLGQVSASNARDGVRGRRRRFRFGRRETTTVGKTDGTLLRDAFSPYYLIQLFFYLFNSGKLPQPSDRFLEFPPSLSAPLIRSLGRLLPYLSG